MFGILSITRVDVRQQVQLILNIWCLGSNFAFCSCLIHLFVFILNIIVNLSYKSDSKNGVQKGKHPSPYLVKMIVFKYLL
jgi:hypothetical protein